MQSNSHTVKQVKSKDRNSKGAREEKRKVKRVKPVWKQ